MVRIIFEIIEDANTALQGMQLNFCKARNTITTLKDVLKEANGRFEVLRDAAIVAAKCNLLDKPEMQRNRKITLKLTRNAVSYFATQSMKLANVEKFIIGQCLEVGLVEAFYKYEFECYKRLQLHSNIFVDHAKFKNI